MYNPFNFHSNVILAAEAYNLPGYWYDIIEYDKSEEPDIGNTHESIAFAGPINYLGEYSESFNYSGGTGRSFMVNPFVNNLRFKFQPAPGYTYQLEETYYDANIPDDPWQTNDYTATHDNPLIIDAPTDPKLRLNIVSADYQEGGQTVVEGCTDSTATNYNPDATQDDGSCEYPAADGKEDKKISVMGKNDDVTTETEINYLGIGVAIVGIVGLFGLYAFSNSEN